MFSTSLIIREMQVKTMTRQHLIPIRMAILKKIKIRSINLNVEKSKSLYTIGGNENSAATMENSMQVPQKIKSRTTILSSNPMPGGKSNRIEIRILKSYLHTHMHSSIIHNSQDMQTTKYPSKDHWKKKICYINTMEYYSALKKKKTLSYATTWMNMEVIMLSQLSRHRRTNTA